MIRPHKWYGKKIDDTNLIYAYWIESIDNETCLMCIIWYDLEDKEVQLSTFFDTYPLACLIIHPDITDWFSCPLSPSVKECHALDWVHV